MVYAFGIDLPVIEIMLTITLLFILGVCFMIWQILNMRKHINVLEKTTLDIKNYEEDESQEVKRFENDITNFESDEAEFFLSKMLPTFTKIQNFTANQILAGKTAEQVYAELQQKQVQPDLAKRVINSVGFFLQYYGKAPKEHHQQHVAAANNMPGAKVPMGVPNKTGEPNRTTGAKNPPPGK